MNKKIKIDEEQQTSELKNETILHNIDSSITEPIFEQEEPSITTESIQKDFKYEENELDNPYTQVEPESSEERDIDDPHSEFADVASHYATSKLLTNRENSAIIQLRHLNNAVKTLLINKYTTIGDRYLDLGAGRGGDLYKISHNVVKHITFVDITKESLMELEKRLSTMRNLNITYKIIEGSICDSKMPLRIKCVEDKAIGMPPFSAFTSKFNPTNITTNEEVNFTENERYDIVSCQFCFNYICSSEDNVRTFFQNLSKLITNNGHIILTFTDTDVLTVKYKTSKGGVIKNPYYSMKFADIDIEEGDFYNTFGIRYNFSLIEAVEELDEYVVPFEKLIEIAMEYEFQVVEDKNFTDFLAEQFLSNKRKMDWKINRVKNNLQYKLNKDSNNCGELENEFAENMNEYENNTKIDKDIWDVFYIYKICVLKKENN